MIANQPTKRPYGGTVARQTYGGMYGCTAVQPFGHVLGRQGRQRETKGDKGDEGDRRRQAPQPKFRADQSDRNDQMNNQSNEGSIDGTIVRLIGPSIDRTIDRSKNCRPNQGKATMVSWAVSSWASANGAIATPQGVISTWACAYATKTRNHYFNPLFHERP